VSCWIQTFSRGKVHPLAPALEELRMLDVAHALSNICRFGGHTRVFYSVAEHSVRVAAVLPSELRLWGLLHDAAEAFVGDLVRPLKHEWPVFVEWEAEILDTILEAHGLTPCVVPPAVHAADNMLLATEFRDLFTGGAREDALDGYLEAPLPSVIQPWLPARAKQEWLLEYQKLGYQTLDAERRPLSLADLVARRAA
jgi:hypothetical protein